MDNPNNEKSISNSNQSTQHSSNNNDNNEQIDNEEINELKQDKPSISEKLREEINDENCLKMNERSVSELPNFENINNASSNKKHIKDD